METLKYTTEPEYEVAMIEIDRLMGKGEANLSDEELEQIRTMALAAQAFEQEHYYIASPGTPESIEELQKLQLKLLQSELSRHI